MDIPAIETRSLTKRYASGRGIEAVSLRVEHGEVFGFLGPNGAGKTTLIRTLLDLQHPTAGSARILGLDSRRESIAVRARIGNLAGDFTADPRLTGRELLRFCAAVRGLADLGAAPALAARLHADLDRPLGELSRGNRQKIGLVQALFHHPELLILDEPTSGLDPLMQEEFVAIVREHRDRGGTVFISSHDLDEVQHLCGRVGIIRSGRLVAVEDVAALRRRAAHHVAVQLADAAQVRGLAAVPGVAGLRADGTRASFDVQGPLDPVVKALADRTVLDITVTEPTLEDLFLAYYETPEAA